MAIVYTDEIHYQNIAKSIREKNGSTTKYSPSEMSAAIDAITVGTGGNELDTSDANATENDIALNKTAYVDGEKITGTLSEVGSDSTLIVPLYSESSITDNFVVKGEIDSDRIFRENGKVEMHVPFSDFGTASKEDVAVGKTFTSKDGFVETGTHVCDGGLDTSDATATEDDVLDGKTAYVKGVCIEGKMPNNGSVHETIDAGDEYTIPKGYHSGEGTIAATPLSEQTEGSAGSDDILLNKTAWVDGECLTGTMPINDDDPINIDLGTSYTIPKGYHSGEGVITATGEAVQMGGNASESDILVGKNAYVDGVLIEGNIPIHSDTSVTLRAGDTYNIPHGYHSGNGVVTADEVEIQMGGTASEGEILNGETAYVDGVLVTGNMPNNGNVSAILNAGQSYKVPKGYHSGEGIITASSLSSQTSGDATSADIVKNKIAWVNGTKVIGNMPNANVRYNTSSFEITNAGVVKGNIYCDTAGYQSTFGTDGIKSTLGTIPIYYNTAVNIIAGESDTVIPAGTYVPYNVTVKGDANLKQENIKSGVSIFGVPGSYEGGGNIKTYSAWLSANDGIINISPGFKPLYVYAQTIDTIECSTIEPSLFKVVSFFAMYTNTNIAGVCRIHNDGSCDSAHTMSANIVWGETTVSIDIPKNMASSRYTVYVIG